MQNGDETRTPEGTPEGLTDDMRALAARWVTDLPAGVPIDVPTLLRDVGAADLPPRQRTELVFHAARVRRKLTQRH